MIASLPIDVIFRDDTVLDSTALISRLTELGLTEDAARQRLLRAAADGILWRSENIQKKGRGRFYALPQSVGSQDFKLQLAKFVTETRPGIGRCLSEIAQSQSIHISKAARLLAAKLEKSGTRSMGRELDALKELGIQLIREGTVLESVIDRTGGLDFDELAMQGLKAARFEAIATRIVMERLRRNSFLSWNLCEFPDQRKPFVDFNKFAFSGTGYSYLSPLTNWKEKRPIGCPVLFDTHWGRIQERHLRSFLERLTRAAPGQSRRKLGVICGHDFEPEILTESRHSGLMVIALNQEYGDLALDSMIQIEAISSNLERGENETEMESFAATIEKLRENPIIADIRSLAFEIATGFILRSNGYERVELGLNVPFQDRTRDVDVHGFLGDTLYAVECKAYHENHSLDEEDVTKFFGQTVPALKSYLRKVKGIEFSKCLAELWTTGPEGGIARQALANIRPPKDTTFNIVSGKQIHEKAPKHGGVGKQCNRLIDALRISKKKPS